MGGRSGGWDAEVPVLDEPFQRAGASLHRDDGGRLLLLQQFDGARLVLPLEHPCFGGQGATHEVAVYDCDLAAQICRRQFLQRANRDGGRGDEATGRVGIGGDGQRCIFETEPRAEFLPGRAGEILHLHGHATLAKDGCDVMGGGPVGG